MVAGVVSKSMLVSVSDSRLATTYFNAQLSLARQLATAEMPFIEVSLMFGMPLRTS